MSLLPTTVPSWNVHSPINVLFAVDKGPLPVDYIFDVINEEQVTLLTNSVIYEYSLLLIFCSFSIF